MERWGLGLETSINSMVAHFDVEPTVLCCILVLNRVASRQACASPGGLHQQGVWGVRGGEHGGLLSLPSGLQLLFAERKSGVLLVSQLKAFSPSEMLGI